MKNLLDAPKTLIELESLPSPYSTLKETNPYFCFGWYRKENIEEIEKIFKKKNILTVIEIGSWLGKSTMHFANLMPSKGKVYAIDHWKGSLEHQPGAVDWHPVQPILYEQFLSNMIHCGLTKKVIPIRMESNKASKQLEVKADFIYIDGAHETESVEKDLVSWYPHLSNEGVMCGDDWHMDSVRQAVEAFAKQHSLQIYSRKSFWSFL